MELNIERPNVEVLGEMEEKMFSIDDLGMIFDILRNKMYSNPIAAICREYSCNARDAHREVGTPDLPVHIYLPNTLEKYYKIQDFGPGISPDRMENIFIKYAASTKRKDNLQTGGFGLGSKTGFSYSDSFSIVTNYNGIQYNYNAFIDPTKVGKLGLGSQSPTNEPNGTTIIIPVQEKHFLNFTTYTESSCRHWTVKPVIHGGDLRWQEPKIVLNGTGWAIAANQDYHQAHKLIVDGVEYPLQIDDLRRYADTKLLDAARGNFLLDFKVGELSLSANRESVYLDERTQAAIRARLDDVLKEIYGKVDARIQAFPNLWEANIYFRGDLRNSFSSLDFLGKLNWQGVELTEGYMHLDCTVFQFTKGAGRSRRGVPRDPNRLTRRLRTHLEFQEKSALYINDLALREPSPRHVKKAFDDDPTLETLQLIVPTDKVTEDVLNKGISLDKMAPKYLSNITKASSRKYTSSGAARLIIFKFDPGPCAFRQVSYASLDEDPNLKVMCFLRKDEYRPGNREAFTKNKEHLSSNVCKILSTKFPNYSFYGVNEDTPEDRVEEDLEQFSLVDDFIEEVFLVANNAIDHVSVKFAQEEVRHQDHSINKYDWPNKITSPESQLLKTFNLHKQLRNMAHGGDGDLLYVYEQLKGNIDGQAVKDYQKAHPELGLEASNELLRKTYPLWQCLKQSYHFDDFIDNVAEYINLIDKSKENP